MPGTQRQPRIQRVAPRRAINTVAALVTEARQLICFTVVENISQGGAKLWRVDHVDIPNCFVLLLSSKGDIRRRCVVVWQTPRAIGVRFVREFTPHAATH